MLGAEVHSWFFWNNKVAWKYTNQHNISKFLFLPFQETKTKKAQRPDMGCSPGRPRARGLLLWFKQSKTARLQATKEAEARHARLPPKFSFGKEPSWLPATQTGWTRSGVRGGSCFRSPAEERSLRLAGVAERMIWCTCTRERGGEQAEKTSADLPVLGRNNPPPMVPSSRSVF